MQNIISRVMRNLDNVGQRAEDAITRLFENRYKTEYDADFANPKELLSKKGKGWAFGDLSLSAKDSTRGAIIYGKTGAGKNVSVLCPSIIRMAGPNNLVIYDPSKELHFLCSGYLHSLGYDVRILDLLNASSGGFNFLRYSRDANASLKIAKVLVSGSLGESKDKFWNYASEGLASVLIRTVKHLPEEYHHMRTVLELCNRLSYAPKDVDRLVVSTRDNQLLDEYKSYIALDPKMLLSILANLKASLNLWMDDEIALATSYDTIGIETWRTDKVAVFLHSSVPTMKYHAPLVSLFFEQAFAEIMQEMPDPAKTRNVYFVIDETGTLSIDLIVPYCNLRKYGSAILSVYQSPFQLQSLATVAGAKALEDNAFARLYMPGTDISVATQLEQTMGKREYRDEKNIRHLRSLMTASEIRESNESLLFCGNSRAMKLHLRPYYEQSIHRFTKLPPFYPSNVCPYKSPPKFEF